MHAPREELQQPVFAAIDTLEFPELHDESIPFMAFLKSLSKLLLAAGVKDFSMQVSSLLRFGKAEGSWNRGSPCKTLTNSLNAVQGHQLNYKGPCRTCANRSQRGCGAT